MISVIDIAKVLIGLYFVGVLVDFNKMRISKGFGLKEYLDALLFTNWFSWIERH